MRARMNVWLREGTKSAVFLQSDRGAIDYLRINKT